MSCIPELHFVFCREPRQHSGKPRPCPSTMSEPGATILFWMHHRRGDSLLPVFIKVPPSTPVPLATVLAYGPPTYLVSSDYELSREFETELRWDPSSQSVFPRSKVLPPTFAHMDVKYYYDRTLRHTPPSQSSTPSIPEE